MKASTLLLTVMSTCILISSCQKSDLSENKNLLKNSAIAENVGNGAKKKNLAIGDYYGGGIVVYIDETGIHGLIVATEDAGSGTWGCYGTFLPGTSFRFETGQENTNAIISNCSEPGIAARLCDELVIREKGDRGKKYDDWFLPSLLEIGVISSGGNLIPNELYWTSTQGTRFMGTEPDGATLAFIMKTYQGADPNDPILYMETLVAKKDVVARVRPIRAF